MFNITAEACQAVAAAIAAAANDQLAHTEDEGSVQDKVNVKDTSDIQQALGLIVRMEKRLGLKSGANDNVDTRLKRIERVQFGRAYTTDLPLVPRCKKACSAIFNEEETSAPGATTTPTQKAVGDASSVAAMLAASAVGEVHDTTDDDLVNDDTPAANETEPATKDEAVTATNDVEQTATEEPAFDIDVDWDAVRDRRKSVGFMAADAASKQAERKRGIRKELIKTTAQLDELMDEQDEKLQGSKKASQDLAAGRQKFTKLTNLRIQLEDNLQKHQTVLNTSKEMLAKREQMFVSEVTDLGLSTDVAHAKLEEVRNATAPMMSKKQQELFVLYNRVKGEQKLVDEHQKRFMQIGSDLETQNKQVRALSEKRKLAQLEAEKSTAAVEKCEAQIDELNKELRQARNPKPKSGQINGMRTHDVSTGRRQPNLHVFLLCGKIGVFCNLSIFTPTGSLAPLFS